VVALILGAGLCLLLSPLARMAGWLDHPLQRKVHVDPTPLVGGVAVFLSVAIVLAGPGANVDPAFAMVTFLALLSGLVDDRWPMSATSRFVVQAVICLVMIYGGKVELRDFGQLMWAGELNLGPMAVPITVFSALGLVNAFNMIDGLDGLGGGVFLVACSAIIILCLLAGQADRLGTIPLVMAAVAGFLLLNARWPWNARARAFLGDSGSVLLGFFLAWQFIALANGAQRVFDPITAVWIMGIPLMDTTRLMSQRWRAGTSAFTADQQHLHHLFLNAGFSVRQTGLLIILLVVLTSVAGIAAEWAGVAEYWRFYAFILLGFVYLGWIRHSLDSGRFLGRQFKAVRSGASGKPELQ